MDARLRTLLRRYATQRDPETAVRVAEESLRAGGGRDIFLYDVVYENLQESRWDSRYTCGIFASEADAWTDIGAMLLDKIHEYEECSKVFGEEYVAPKSHVTIRRLVEEKKYREATALFCKVYGEDYIIEERQLR